jgi:hypothetical protein
MGEHAAVKVLRARLAIASGNRHDILARVISVVGHELLIMPASVVRTNQREVLNFPFRVDSTIAPARPDCSGQDSKIVAIEILTRAMRRTIRRALACVNRW